MNEVASLLSIILSSEQSKGGRLFLTILLALFVFASLKILDLLFEMFRQKLNKQKNNEGIAKREDADIIVQNLITNALPTVGGDRIQVVEFTNSVKNIALVPFRYMSCTYEAYRIGLSPQAQSLQEINTSLFGVLLSKLANKLYMILDSENKIKEIPESSYSLLNNRLAAKSLYIALNSPVNKRMIGYITLDNSNQEEFTETVIKSMKSISDQVGTLLTLEEW